VSNNGGVAGTVSGLLAIGVDVVAEGALAAITGVVVTTGDLAVAGGVTTDAAGL
jgi:hypothetical protein